MARRLFPRPFLRSALRQVRDTLPRFLSILLITVLGVAFFSGLRLTGPFMKTSAEIWFDDRNIMDVQIYSTMGFNDADIAALRATSGVVSLAPGYHTNVLIRQNNRLSNTEVSAQFLSMDLWGADGSGTSAGSSTSAGNSTSIASGTGAAGNTPNLPLNAPELLSGRLPTSPNECLAEPFWLEQNPTGLGTIVQVFSGTADPLSDKLVTDTFTVVGIAKSPLFIAEDRGNSEIGSGHNSYFFLVLPSAFAFEVYTTVYLQVDLGEKTLALSDATSRLLPFSRFDDAYFDAVATTIVALERTSEIRSIERYDEIISDALKELADARLEVDDGYKKLQDAQAELEDARIELEKALAELEEGRVELDDGWAKLATSRRQLDDGWAKSNASRWLLDAGWAQINASRKQLDASWAVLDDSRIELDEGWAEYKRKCIELEYLEAHGLITPEELEYAKLMLEQAHEELLFGEAEFESGRQRLEAAEADLAIAIAELEAGEAAYQNGLLELYRGEAAYQSGLVELQESELSLASGFDDYNRGKADYEKGLATFEQEHIDALAELAQAEEDIAQAEADLMDLKYPKWYVLDLQSNPGFRSYKQESEQLESIAQVIPLLFFLIAALISMTSMTRLVDKDRIIIGTYKALGYTNGAITARYLLYAASASFIGGVLGIIIGYNLFPPLIFNAFRTIYIVPPAPPFFSWQYAILSIAFALISTVGPAILVTLRTLHETPASAMRPLAPRPGKRIILERIKPLWHRLSFLHKITARNLFRYKKRASMTIIGIAGCTALMFAGFGLNDSLATLGPKQFGQIQRYDVAISFNTKAEPEELDRFYDFISQSPELGTYTIARREIVEIVGETLTKDLAIIVPEDPGGFQDYYALQPRTTGFASTPQYSLTEEGVILTEQIARQIGVELGSTITLRTLDNEEAQFVVSAIIENYLYHYVFMTPAAYERGFGEKPVPNQVLGLFTPGSTDLPETITDLPAVTGVAYTQRSADSFASITDVLGFVMAILILSAALQAFVVLFSLNTINREERARELASIKVLGFFNRELATYIYREGIVLTILGILLGLILGVGLERYIINTIEIDVFMFSRDLLATSYVYSALLTALFAVIVNLLIYRPLTRIDMVSSLKAVE